MEEDPKDELKVVLTYFKRSEILGSNGCQVEFLIRFYELLEEDFIIIIEEVRTKWNYFGVCNFTLLALIPKKIQGIVF
jgi:hypothetical protein